VHGASLEEAGSLTGIGATGNVDNHFGTLTFRENLVDVAARRLNISLAARFNSDHLYSCGVIKRIAKSEKPSTTLMTLPPHQTTFYRIADGLSWQLPWVQVGVKNTFRVCIDGRTFDLLNTITDETWGGLDGEERWTEGYHVIFKGTENSTAEAVIVIPEILTTITCEVAQSASPPNDYTVSAHRRYRVRSSSATRHVVGGGREVQQIVEQHVRVERRELGQVAEGALLGFVVANVDSVNPYRA
jgi:hypothetical protein